MNRSQFAASFKSWFVASAAFLLIILASGLDVFAQNVSLTYNSVSTFTVPAGVTSITVKATGAAGGTGGLDGGGNTPTPPGSLGFVNAVYSVSPGNTIGIYPGFKGENGSTGTNCCGGAGGASSFGNYGGGAGGNASFSGSSGGGGGGGAATIVTRNGSVVAIAAGGPGGGGHGNCFNSGYGGATWIAAGSTTFGTNGAYGNTCGSSDGGGGGGGGGGELGGLGGWTHVTTCGGECAGDGGYIGTNGVYGAASITSNTIIGNTNVNGEVVIEYTAVAGTASANQTICSGNSPSNLFLSGFIGDIQWQVSSNNSSFSNISGATSATLSSLQMGVLTATRYYRAVVSGVAISNVVTVTVNPSPLITVSNSLCSSNTLQWMTMNNIAAGSASGVGQNGVTVAITQSGSGMLNVNGMYEATQFPAQFNVPSSGATIANQYSGNFQACFSQPVVNPVVAFSSIGNPGNCVPIIVSQPYSVVWNGQGMTYTSSTQMTGCEGKTIIRLDGTVTCVNFNYTQSEYYSTIAFGFENQNCFSPTVCSGNSVTLNAAGAANYTWTPSTGLNTASGASVIASPATTTTYTVSDPTDICATPQSITVNVNPTPVVTVPANIVEMTGTTIPAQTFTSSVAGTTFAWTNSTPSIGLAASGTASTPSFVATNTTASPVTGTINVTPTAPNTCVGAAQSFTITVDPTPNVNDPANVVNCEGTLTTVDFNGTTANTNYIWTNTNTAIGLAASGSNDLSFTSQNPSNVAQTATVTVTPQAYVTQGYVWGSVNENGTLTLNAPAGKIFTNVTFASYGTPTTPVNGNYTLGACNAASSSSVISGLAIGNSTMTVVANNATFGDPCPTSSKALAVKLGYGVSITGVPQNFTITVNPSATIANSADTICTGTAFTFATATADIVPANTTYTWAVVNNTNITGEAAQATGLSGVSQTLLNLTSVDQIAAYTVTPTSGAAACVGAPFTYNVTVTPLPTTISTAGPTTFCDGGSVTLIAPVAPIQMSYTYQWNLNGTPISGATSISYIAVASGSYTVTVTNNVGCSATSLAVVVTENTLPTVAAITGTTTICVGSTTTLSSITSGGTWSSSNTAIATVNSSTGIVTGVTAGSAVMTYTVTNVNGCINSQTATVTVNALPTATILTGGPTSFCQGGNVTLTASPQVAGSTYLWSNGATTTSIVANTTSTNTVTITTAAGCATTANAVTVTVNALPTATITASGSTTFCQGGSVTLTANAGTGLSYQWTNGSNNQTLSVNTGGSNTVTVTDANGCSTTSAATVVTVNSLPSAPAITGTASVCVGSTTLLSTTASIPVWSSANSAIATVAANGLVTGVSAGSVALSYTTTNVNGCVNSQSVTVTVNILPTAAISTLGATTFCQGGSVNLLASSAPAGLTYTYQWRLNGTAITGATSSTYVANASGAYSVTITTNSGCEATSTATTVTVNPLPVLAANAGASSVCEGSTAVITNAQSGGLWSTANNTVAAINATTGMVTGVNPGTTTLTYTFTNANGCTNTVATNFTVNALPAAVITANGATTFCQGGSVVLSASAGSSYLWSNGATTQTITVSTTQDVSVTVTNANGCASTSALTSVTVNSLPLANITSMNGNSFCQGGSVTLVASTGSSYSWSNGPITQSITLSASANVSVTITNANGCSATSAPFTVTMNPAPVATITAGGATTFCAGGSVTLTAPSAAAYLWSSGETTQSIIASVDGPYSVTITDGNGCTATSANTNITVLAVPSVQAIAGSNAVCVGSTTTLTNATIGGTWSSSNTSIATISATGLLSGMANGSATITYNVTNANGCSTAVQFNVNVNDNPTLSSNAGSAAVCVGSTTTLANAQAGGIWSSSDVAIADIAANGTVTGINAGTAVISYTYTNVSGCTSQVSTTVQVNALPAATVTTTSPTTFCAGGSVTLTAPSGMTYAWSTGEPTQSITVSTSGSYTVTVTNTNGCSSTSAPVAVSVNALPAVSIANVGATTFCVGGSVTLIAPLNSNFTYAWNNGANAISGASNNTYIASATGAYTLTVTDANGCTATSAAIPVTVNVIPVVTATASGATTFCAGGSVTLSATGAATYVWSNGATTPSITVNSSDSYSVTGTTVEGCASLSNAIAVVVNALPTASISSTGSTVCLGSTVTLTATGGSTYSWSNGATNASINVTAGNTYTATVTSAEGCTSTASETVVFNANPAVVISANGPTVFCVGGSLTLTATGGSNYVWSNGDQGASTTVNQSGNYYVIVTNAAGCTTQSSVINVTVNNNPVVASITGANAVCEGGFMQLTSATQGGVWSAANNFIANIDGAGNVTGLNAGSTTITYTVTINGCAASTSAQVSVLNNPVAPIITASGSTTLCPGGTVVLFASNGANYQWSSGATTPFIVANQSGAYTVSVTGLNGCSATSSPVQVFIGDDTAPSITAPLNVTTTPNLGCEAIGVALGSPMTSDNCGVATVTNDAPSIFPIGPTVVTWTVTDNSGNTASATQVVTVVDNNAPMVQAPANVSVASNVYCEAIGVALGNPIATDNCTENLTITNNAPAVYPIGATTVTWTVVDGAGNITTVDQVVTVTDESAPQVLLANTSVILDANGTASLGFADLDNGTVDNCGIANVVLSQSAFDCSHVGENLITVYVTDNSGNQSSASVLVTVVASDACGGSQWSGPTVPDAFTPNGNNYNDTWVIPGLEGYTTKKMEIYSRYGTVVYAADNYNNDWDGTLLNTGTSVPDGTYYYILTLNGGKQLNGYVYINRVQK